MKITVLNILYDMVHVSTDIGDFIGYWCSNSSPQKKDYQVELDYDKILMPEDINASNDCRYYIKNIEGDIFINGFVEEIEGSILYLRLFDSIIMLEINIDKVLKKYEKKFVNIKICYLNIFDINE